MIDIEKYRKPAEEGDAEAQYSLGYCYQFLPPIDNQAAFKWHKLAAEQGHKNAQFCLGWMYSGEGVPKDDQEAVKWFRLAAEQGHKEAQYYLGKSYKKGEGVSKDIDEALKWYKLAAEQNHKEAKQEIKKMQPKMSDKSSTETKKASKKTKEKLVEKSYYETLYEVSDIKVDVKYILDKEYEKFNFDDHQKPIMRLMEICELARALDDKVGFRALIDMMRSLIDKSKAYYTSEKEDADMRLQHAIRAICFKMIWHTEFSVPWSSKITEDEKDLIFQASATMLTECEEVRKDKNSFTIKNMNKLSSLGYQKAKDFLKLNIDKN
jgi:TPR repeat protein